MAIREEVEAMMARGTNLDSSSVGDPARFLMLSDLERELDGLTNSPRDLGRVALLVRRGEGGRREILNEIHLSSDDGIPGDAWSRGQERNPEAQITVMQAEVARLIANGQPLALFGDGLFLELDLSVENLPVFSRVQVGGAVLEVTPRPHNGCRKFQARFGQDALRFVSKPDLRHLNLRGIYMRVIEPGDVRPGDSVEVISRGRG